MIPMEVIYRVLEIDWSRNGHRSSGTAFSMTLGDRQLMVTAAHVVQGYPNGLLTIGRDGKTVLPQLLGISDRTDIAVFDAPDSVRRDGLPLHAGMGGLMLGQRVYWMGYPLGIDGGLLFPETDERWCGLAGAGIVSGMQVSLKVSPPAATHGFIVDGLNNPGYSGSPVCFYPGEIQKPIRVAGVVSASLAPKTNFGLMIAGNLTSALEEILGRNIKRYFL